MVRRSGWVRVFGVGFRGFVVLGGALAFVVPACGGKSVTTGDDDGAGEPSVPDDDDIIGDNGDGSSDDSGGPLGGRGGSTPTPPQGGTGATGGAVITGGAFPMGGAVGMGGSFPAGGTVSTGGTIAIGGTTGMGGFPTGGDAGRAPSGGAGPLGGSGPGGVGGTGGVNSDLECRGIRSNMPCALEGKQCSNLACGLADSGRRTCACATNWQCVLCDFTNSPFRDRPAVIPQCPASAADEVACTQQNSVCGPVGAEYCACYLNPTDGLIWDCDSPPITW
jgi:hypothetical protein